jgi:hypothetical protein
MGDAAFDRRSCAGQCAVDGLLGGGEVLVGATFDGGRHPRSGALVGEVGDDGDARAFADPDDAVRAGCGQAVAGVSIRQSGRTRRIAS